MSAINLDSIKQLTDTVEAEGGIEAYFNKFQIKYKNNLTYNQLSNVLQRVNNINKKITDKNEPILDNSNEERVEIFAFGELKIFTWVLCVYCYLNNIYLEQLNQKNFEEIRSIFPNKSHMFIRYEIMCLAHERTKYAPAWTQEEINLLTKIVHQKQNVNEWRQISFQLFCSSKGELYRPFQQCRQKWFNHLDPKVRKGKWSIEEDISLLTAVEFLDCKWIEIYRQLQGVRTEHMIKNRYKSILKKWKKKYDKTSPKKIVSLVLKYLKTKLKRGDLNSSQSSNESEKVPLKKQKKSKVVQANSTQSEQEKVDIIAEKTVEIEKEEIIELEKQEEINQQMSESPFELGLSGGEQFNNNWKTSIQISLESEEQRAINTMVLRNDDYFDGFKVKEERKTSDSDDEEAVMLSSSNFSARLPEICSENELISVSGFENIHMIEPESGWFEDLQQKWDLQQDFDMLGI